MRIPTNVILIWAGLNASIPTGYTRETSLDGKFIKGTANATEPNVTGGSDTHTHTSPAHSHALNPHTHVYDLTSAGITTSDVGSGTLDSPRDTHTHDGRSGAATGGTTSSDAVTYAAGDSKPPYYEVIFIKSGGATGLPDDVIALFDKTTIPDGWQECNGQNSSPDFRNRYLRGATGGGNAGTTGGSLNHTHAIGHTHTAQNHSHVAAASNGVATAYGVGWAIGVYSAHTHQVTLANSVQNLNANADTLSPTENVEPVYKKLIAIQNQNGRFDKPKYIIGMWLGNLADIPKGWVLCDGNNGTQDLRNYFVKLANTSADIGATGGNNAHTHAAQGHGHTSNGTHTHTGSSDAHVNAPVVHENQGSGAGHKTLAGSVHPVANVEAVTASYANADTTADSSDNQPAFRTVAFIQFQKEIYSAGMLGAFL